MSSNTDPTPMLVRFYDPIIRAPDPDGRTLSSILALPDIELEYCHDYIQLLFPLPEPSTFHPSAPIIDKATFLAFRSRPDLQAQLTTSLTRMLHFYGFEISSPSPPASTNTTSTITILPSPAFPRASRTWLRRFNHNHLRITRIIRSLRVLGLSAHAAALFSALSAVYDGGRSGVGSRSMMFWTRAAERPLYMAPEEDDDEGRRRGFLYEFEFEAGREGRGEGDDTAAAA
ncbi:hypothetical protein IMSHALPRED_002141 [Imshaugia aleurites]|uniref:Opioid growth factor receptor (OGFr) conserved domain-containing protein n=1 Tax=Imshaugia aleurites TaxID=172621 RepID=A0A8H3J4X2_9LECA|nr:hypothetical protein IMSHALPRED_002141 [Imshaugia aleurites]